MCEINTNLPAKKELSFAKNEIFLTPFYCHYYIRKSYYFQLVEALLLYFTHYRKSAYFCCRLIFSDFADEQDSQKYFS